jgi:hypothetical protein
MSFTANSTAVSFNTCVVLTSTANPTGQTIIAGYNNVNGIISANGFEVEAIQDISTIKVGQVFPASTTTGQAGTSALLYFTDATNNFLSQPGNPQGTVTITGITSTSISGTFAGLLFSPGDTGGATTIYTITNGSFTAQR